MVTSTETLRAPAAIRDAQPLAGEALRAAKKRFSPRPYEDAWPATSQSYEEVVARLNQPPLRAASESTHFYRRRGATLILRWLLDQPGATWQQRWNATPAATSTGAQWNKLNARWVGYDAANANGILNTGLFALVCADVLRPSLHWQLTRTSTNLRAIICQYRDPEGFARLQELVGPEAWSSHLGILAKNVLVKLVIAKGGGLADINVGDAIEYMEAHRAQRATSGGQSLFYSWLKDLGHLPPDAPVSLRLLHRTSGQVSVEQLVDRYRPQSKPIRDLLVEYLKERQPTMDYTSLEDASRTLVRNFWLQIERIQPGIDTLRLLPEVVSAWKQVSRTKVTRRRLPDGTVHEAVTERANYGSLMIGVRALYLDLAHWAVEEPERWGPWVAPCPVSAADASTSKHEKRRKAKMDQRTRERLPALSTVVRAARANWTEAREGMEALQAAPLGGQFTFRGRTYTRQKKDSSTPFRAYDESGRRVHLGLVEERAFWAWATIEFLQHTGVRIEEMLEASHHALIKYKLPTSGEVVPLLQVAPSKTDEERLLLVSPELADVLSTIIARVRDPRTGAIPMLPNYDVAEKIWNPPMPLLFQWTYGGQRTPVSRQLIRNGLNEVLERTGLTDSAGQPLDFAPHDFRRIFITDAIRSGLPPHIAQVLAGHSDINTTMGYNAIYPADAIEAHRAFIARRRSLRPSEEYRTPTNEEWDAFLAHFEKRKLSLGTCARAFGTLCIHEHACVRCSLLRPEPSQRDRLTEIRDNLLDRIAEAQREGWLGEVEGLEISLAGAEDKLTQLDAALKPSVIHLGLPTFGEIAARTT
ncbi:site-specific integrase [Streptomyces sp. NBC_00264]|uniref:tyrosine-type recombinase/integrase n=1 Tax=unclassified Streptomyces TaxID=2593676 RepID=UPI00225673D0|nr:MULTISPECIES: site-specific integrase [unclassified Streptomyces]MCX4399412.1 site-specific integrase [Streptomyces sp. NBC_01767]MCX5165975.1 site-specific integrase [Streptomyces sp. NBC_00305]MCX5224580.1 site-specific integrase [Streptomyces sp. NBC_00264]